MYENQMQKPTQPLEDSVPDCTGLGRALHRWLRVSRRRTSTWLTVAVGPVEDLIDQPLGPHVLHVHLE